MRTIITIGSTAYDGSARAAGRFIGIDGLTRTTDGYDRLDFTVDGCGPAWPFPPGVAVTVDTTDDDGSNPKRRFVGDLLRPEARHTKDGWTYSYSAAGLKRRGDYVTLIGPDGTGVASFNLTPDDDYYSASTAGRTVGQIVRAVLEASGTQSSLAQAGIGNYALDPSGVPVLPAQTIADLAALTIVPPNPVRLSGQAVLSILEQFLQAWHPRFALWVEPTGLIRVRDIFALPTVPLTLPGDTGQGDPVDGLAYTVDCEGCYTAYSIVGLDIDAFLGSLKYGTLKLASSPDDVASATILDWLQPKDSADLGTVLSCSSTSCVVKSDIPTGACDAQFWVGRGAQVRLIDTTNGTSIELSTTRRLTANTALAPGGTYTLTWDSSQPVGSTTYNRYRIEGDKSPKALVWRDFHINEPATGKQDKATWVGSHLFPFFPKGYWWANNSSKLQVTGPAAIVQFSGDGSGNPPFYELPVGVEIDRDTGRILLTQPAPYLSASYQSLLSGYPATEAAGAPHDVLVVIPYNRGSLAAKAPTTGFDGTAYTKYGIQRTLVYPMESFVSAGDLPLYRQLAAEKLAVVKDAVVSGSISHHGYPASFDPLAIGYAFSLAIAGTTGPLDGLALPVRTARVTWPNSGPDQVRVDFSFSNFKRPFEGDALFVHPGLGAASLGFDGGDGMFGAPAATFAAPEFGPAGGDPSDFGDDFGFGGFDNPGARRGSGRDASGAKIRRDVGTPFWQDEHGPRMAPPGVSQADQVAKDKAKLPFTPEESVLEAMLGKEVARPNEVGPPAAPKESGPRVADADPVVRSAPGPLDLASAVPPPRPRPPKPPDDDVRIFSVDDDDDKRSGGLGGMP